MSNHILVSQEYLEKKLIEKIWLGEQNVLEGRSNEPLSGQEMRHCLDLHEINSANNLNTWVFLEASNNQMNITGISVYTLL